MIKFNQNQNTWLKPYTDMNNNLRKISKKIFRKLINNAVFGKAMEIVRKQRDIKLVTTERWENYLVTEPIYQLFDRTSISKRNEEKAEILVNKPASLRLSILELSKMLLYELRMIMQSQNMMKKQNSVIWIQIVSLYT